MKLPAHAATATTRLEVVRITAGPEHRGDAMTGDVVAHWHGPEAAAALTVIGKLPTSTPNLCAFAPGWGIRAYTHPDAAPPLFEAAFCYGCDEVWLWGPAVPEPLGRQLFDSSSPNAQYLRMRFRSAARGLPPAGHPGGPPESYGMAP
ncbi:hypothetical protein [Streptomyces sp. NPDC059072]|uniref:hypothetical protein n=1 Tax=unclassified Streptomyces TaxID=2593676 RepID=UPI0036D12B98